MPKSTPAPLPLAPLTLPTEVFTAAAHALCRERGDLDDTTPSAVETDTAIAVLARHAPPSVTQRRGVRLARRIIDDVAARRRGPAELRRTGKQRPSLSDFIAALTGNDPFSCSQLQGADRPALPVRAPEPEADRRGAQHTRRRQRGLALPPPRTPRLHARTPRRVHQPGTCRRPPTAPQERKTTRAMTRHDGWFTIGKIPRRSP